MLATEKLYMLLIGMAVMVSSRIQTTFMVQSHANSSKIAERAQDLPRAGYRQL